ncbi:hypothetical protein Gotri_002170 [Gossypium trilobum]|uniref:Pentatricopeptide repeat-containing protein n=1 Tax=Gossypium trilobum TaxID=34281 RepID=A0A7J9F7F0_9ROSI|nr:hypothetical protein [Gossypium trilobum]
MGFQFAELPYVKCSQKLGEQSLSISRVFEKKPVKKAGKNEHHLWEKRDSASSGQKAFNLVRIVSQLPNEKETVYGALDKWVAWETEFPLIAAAKALRILRKRSQWLCVIQVIKWMLSKGQGATMGTYMTPFYLHLIWRIEWIRLDHCGTRFYIHTVVLSQSGCFLG